MTKALAPVAILLISVSILLTGQGLQGTLLPVRASLEDFSTIAIGTMGAAYFFGFTVGCLKGGELLRRVGHVRVFLAMSALASASPLLHGLIIQPLVWGSLRMLTGFCFAVLYVVIESWLNELSDNENRGVIFSTYAMITLTVFAGGQMMTLLYDPQGLQLFIIASILVSIGAVPIALSTSPIPQQPQTVSVDVKRLFEISPSGALACLVTGLANGAFWALGPVYATSLTNTVEIAAWFMTSAVIGGAIAQWPLGLFSDLVGRRKVLIAVSLVGGIVGLLLFVAAPVLNFTTANILAAFWGALAFPLYTIAVAYANDFAEAGEYVMVSSGLLLMYGIGATIGPFAASALMTMQGTGSLFLFTALVHIALVAYVMIRFLRRRTQAKQQIAFSDALSAAQTASQVFEEDIQPHSPDDQ
ncbi:MAG: MFS transporter [Gammaproteobacteria bacterium]|nr:MFS transporter [Gammaproteobacteria bacterium]MBT8111965.1 MFS transporter [Gammaproteobacteria bacterium]NND48333.1 MFS transporter [Woeseiaceae bacterium]NNL46665.1 MFS transporter [Woeseiaceae bacterium]